MLGVPSMTSDLSGFGLFVRERVSEPSDYGIYVIDRRFKSVEESIGQMSSYMFKFCGLTRRQRVNLRNRTERLSDIMGWSVLEHQYFVARYSALHQAFPAEFDAMSSSRVAFKVRFCCCLISQSWFFALLLLLF